MNKRTPALISTISNALNDFTLDIAVNKYSIYQILFWTTVGSFLFQVLYSFSIGFTITKESVIFLIFYAISILLGYFFYAKSLKHLPVGLTAMVESGGLFIFLIIDSITGKLEITGYFLFLFAVFIFATYLFLADTLKLKNLIKNKQIKKIGLLFLMISMIFYTFEPYLIQASSLKGASITAINISYYLLAIPCFYFLKKKESKEINASQNNKGIVKIIIMIAVLESLYYLFGTAGYINETAIINEIIQEIRVFILVILSIFAKTDKFTLKKGIATILAMGSVIAIYFY